MNNKRAKHRQTRRAPTTAPVTPPNSSWWLIVGVVAALAIAAAIGIQSWLADAEQPFQVTLEMARRGAWPEVSQRLAETDLSQVEAGLLTELGSLASAARQFDVAIGVLTPVAQRSGSDQARALAQLVALCRATRRTTDAELYAEKLCQLEPGTSEWWRLLADVYRELGDEVREAGALQRALEQAIPAQDARMIRHQLCERLVHLGDAESARRVLEQLESTLPARGSRQERVRLDVTRARLLRLEGRPRDALSSLDRAMPELGQRPLAFGLRGTILMDLGEFQPAIAELSRAVQLLPYDEVLHFKLAEAYRRTDQPELSQRHLQAYQRIHATRLEIDQLAAVANERPLSVEEQTRLAELYALVGEARP